MPLEKRTGLCNTCGGMIYRYPNPNDGQPDLWAHRDQSDWRWSPHDATPKEDQ